MLWLLGVRLSKALERACARKRPRRTAPPARARLEVEEYEKRVLLANTLLYIGPANGNWSVANNWAIAASDGMPGDGPVGGNAAPRNGDRVLFNPGQVVGIYTGTDNSSTDDMTGLSLAKLITNSKYTATTTLSTNLTVTTLQAWGGTLALAPQPVLTPPITLTLTGTGSYKNGHVGGDSSHLGGTLTGPGVVQIEGDANFGGGGNFGSGGVTLQSITINDAGLLIWRSGSPVHNNGATIDVSGVFKVLEGGTMDNTAPAGEPVGALFIEGVGQLETLGTGRTTDIQVGVSAASNASPDVEVTAGTLQLDGANYSAGQWSVAAGAQLIFTSLDGTTPTNTWAFGTSFTGGGTTSVEGSSRVVIQQGVTVTAGNLYLGGAATVQGPGTLQISQGSTLTWTGSATVGGDPNSNLNLSILAGATANLSSTPTLDHATFTNAGTVNVAGLTTFDVNNGAQIINNNNFFFPNSPPSPTIEQTAGATPSSITNTGLFQNNGNGTPVIGINYSQAGSRGRTAGSFKFTGQKVSLLDGTFDATGASIEVANTFEQDGGSVLAGNGGTLLADSGFTQTGGDVALSGTGLMTVTGTYAQTGGTAEVADTSSLTASTLNVGGILTLEGGSVSAANDVEVVAGGLLVADSGSLSGGSAGVLVDLGGILTAYSATLDGDLSNSGIVNLGDPTVVGTLPVSGDYTQSATGTLLGYLGGTATGEYSQLTAAGEVNFAGTLDVAFIDGFVAAPGDSFTLLTDGSDSGTFATPDLPALTSGTWAALYDQPPGTFILEVTTGQQGATLVIDGPMTLDGGSLTGYDSVEVAAGGSLDLEDGAIVNAPGGVQVDAGGTLIAGSGTIDGDLSNAGTLDLTALTISGDYTQSAGTLNLGNGSLTVAGSFAEAGGSVQVGSGGTLAADDGLVQTGGDLALSGTGGLNIVGTLAQDGGTAEVGGTSSLAATALTVGGTVTVEGGTLSTVDGVQVETGGTLALQSGILSGGQGSVAVDPGATLTGYGGTLSGDLLNSGTITLGQPPTGTFTVTGNYTQGGSATLTVTGGPMQVDGTIAEDGGAVQLGSGGTLTVTGDYALAGGGLTLSGGTLTVLGLLDVSGGTLTLTAGTLTGSVQVEAGGNLTASGGTLNGDLSDFGAVTASTLTVTGNYGQAGTASLDVSGGSVTVDGSFEEDGGSVLLGSGGTLNADNGVTQTGGDLALSGGMMNLGTGAFAQSGGTLEVASLSSLYAMTMTFGGTVTLEGGSVTAMTDVEVLSGGALLLEGGTLSGDMGGVLLDAGATLTASSGTISGSLSNSGTLTLDDPTTPGTLTITGGYTQVTGTLDATGGSLTTNSFEEDGGAVVVGSGGTVTAYGWTQTGGDLALSGTGAVNDNGMFQQSGGTTEVTGTATLSAYSVSIGGTLTLAGGTIAVGMGAVEVDSGGLLLVDSGTLSSSMGGVQVDGGGTLTAYSGTIAGNLSNSGTVNLGDPTTAGTLAVSGNYTQSVGTLNTYLGGTASGSYSQLSVGGQADFGGTLDASLSNGFQPAPGDAFTLLSYGSGSGTFATLNLPPLSTGSWDPVYDNVQDTFTLAVTS
jgi:fibronectin-binding autotransporter adhesin